MKKSFKKRMFLASIIAGAMVLSILTGCQSNKKANDKIVIGGIGPLTGALSQYGNASINGAKLAIKEINENGGVNGKQVEFIVLDDKGDSQDATTAYSKLTAENNIVALIGAITSKPTLPIAQRAAKDNLPMITPTATADDITKGRDNVFRVCFLDPDQGKIMADFAADTLGAKKAAVISNASDDYSTGLAQAFIDKAKIRDIEIVADESYQTGDKDFKAQLTKIVAAQPDVLFVPDYYSTDILILSQAKAAGLTAPLLGGDGWDTILEQTAQAGEADGNFFANHFAVNDTDEKVTKFIEVYEKEYGSVPSSFSALGYDAAKILLQAIADAEEDSSEAIIKAIQGINFDGVTGKINFDQNGDPLKPISIIEIKDHDYILKEKKDIIR